METKDLGRIVKNNTAKFSFFRAGILYYVIDVDGITYSFAVPADDLGGASVMAEHKAITLMRYIRKALEDETFVRASS